MSRAEEFIELRDVYLDTLLACADLVLAETPLDDSLAGASPKATGEGMGWLESEVRREYEQIRESVLEDPVKPFSNEWFEASGGDVRAVAERVCPSGCCAQPEMMRPALCACANRADLVSAQQAAVVRGANDHEYAGELLPPWFGQPLSAFPQTRLQFAVTVKF